MFTAIRIAIPLALAGVTFIAVRKREVLKAKAVEAKNRVFTKKEEPAEVVNGLEG